MSTILCMNGPFCTFSLRTDRSCKRCFHGMRIAGWMRHVMPVMETVRAFALIRLVPSLFSKDCLTMLSHL